MLVNLSPPQIASVVCNAVLLVAVERRLRRADYDPGDRRSSDASVPSA